MGIYEVVQISIFFLFSFLNLVSFFFFAEKYLRNIRDTKEGVVIMRGSKWGNPYSTQRYGRRRAIELFEKYFLESGLVHSIEELRGCRLICACAPDYDCHGDIILKHLYKY